MVVGSGLYVVGVWLPLVFVVTFRRCRAPLPSSLLALVLLPLVVSQYARPHRSLSPHPPPPSPLSSSLLQSSLLNFDDFSTAGERVEVLLAGGRQQFHPSRCPAAMDMRRTKNADVNPDPHAPPLSCLPPQPRDVRDVRAVHAPPDPTKKKTQSWDLSVSDHQHYFELPVGLYCATAPEDLTPYPL